MNQKKKQFEHPQLTSTNTPFDILNTTSNISYLYKLNAPFQITYEYCSGSCASDYLNILSLSGNGQSFFQESIDLHNYLFQNKAPHSHDHYEFLIVLDGSLIQKIEGQEYLYPAGYSCLINRNLLHTESFSQATKVLFLGFSADFFSGLST